VYKSTEDFDTGAIFSQAGISKSNNAEVYTNKDYEILCTDIRISTNNRKRVKVASDVSE